jgi:excisionase family DNA binding protein
MMKARRSALASFLVSLELEEHQVGTSTTKATGDAIQPLLSIDQAAKYLNVPARWVAEAVRLRKVRCTRIGKHVRFRLEHLDELVDAGEQPVTERAQLAVVPTQPGRTGGRSRL